MASIETKTAATQSKDAHKLTATVASLHYHPPIDKKNKTVTKPMIDAETVTLVPDYGIGECKRKYKNRQITMIERPRLRQIASALGVPEFVPGAVRSNIELEGDMDLMQMLVDKLECMDFETKENKARLWESNVRIQIGESCVLQVYEAREPCVKMESVANGLEKLFQGSSFVQDDGRHVQGIGHLNQGLILKVITGGKIKIGDQVRWLLWM